MAILMDISIYNFIFIDLEKNENCVEGEWKCKATEYTTQLKLFQR